MADLTDEQLRASIRGWEFHSDARPIVADAVERLLSETETLKAQVAYLERELANLKSYAASLAQLLSERSA